MNVHRSHLPDVRFAALSDIHGNRWALEAVLADMKHREIELAVNLGDSLYGPLDPAGTADVLATLDFPTVRGNEDRILLEGGDTRESPSLAFCRERLGMAHMRWLRSLPATLVVFDDGLMFHGTPSNDDEYLMVDISPGSNVPAEDASIFRRLSGITPASLLLCGHDHLPRTRTWGNTLIVNPGSVGLPAYRASAPSPHLMQAGSPHARYAVVTRRDGGWAAEHVSVPYDWQLVASIAAMNGRDDWAQWLRTGKSEA